MNFGKKRALTKRSRSQDMWGEDRQDPGSPCGPESDVKETVKRKSRNMSEKKRRDQFNLLVQELCSMVSNNRKMDKTTVIKTAISVIQANKTMADEMKSQEIHEDWKPSFMSNNEFVHLMLEAVDGFIMVVAVTGKILYVSESVTPLLGHLPDNLQGKSLLDFVHSSDRTRVHNALSKRSAPYAQDYNFGAPQMEDYSLRLCFHAKCGSVHSNEPPLYELVQLQGQFEPYEPTDGALSAVDCNTCVCCTVRLKTSQIIRELPSLEDVKREFTSRYSLEWKFLFLDHRGPPIIGYLPFEVLGTSGYDYIHPDDLTKLSRNHEQLMQSGEGKSCYYRFMTKGQQWIWLQSRYYITYHQWNSKPEFVVCTNTVVSYPEVLAWQRRNSGSDEVQAMDTDNKDNPQNSPSREPSSTTRQADSSSTATASSSLPDAFMRSRSVDQQPSSSTSTLSPNASPSQGPPSVQRMYSEDSVLSMRPLEALRDVIMAKRNGGPRAEKLNLLKRVQQIKNEKAAAANAKSGTPHNQSQANSQQQTQNSNQQSLNQEQQSQPGQSQQIQAPPQQQQQSNAQQQQSFRVENSSQQMPDLQNQQLFQPHQNNSMSQLHGQLVGAPYDANAMRTGLVKQEALNNSQQMAFNQMTASSYRVDNAPLSSPHSPAKRSPEVSTMMQPPAARKPLLQPTSPMAPPTQPNPAASPIKIMPAPSPQSSKLSPAPSPSSSLPHSLPSPQQSQKVDQGGAGSQMMTAPASSNQLLTAASPSPLMQNALMGDNMGGMSSMSGVSTPDMMESSQAMQAKNIQQQLHIQLLEKHRMLQSKIIKQQQELQRISEQLLYASQFSASTSAPATPDTNALGSCLSMLMPGFDLDQTLLTAALNQSQSLAPPQLMIPQQQQQNVNQFLVSPSPQQQQQQQPLGGGSAPGSNSASLQHSLSLSSLDVMDIQGSPMSMMLAAQDSLLSSSDGGGGQDPMFCGGGGGGGGGTGGAGGNGGGGPGPEDAFGGADSQTLTSLQFDTTSHTSDASDLFSSQRMDN